jgi:hypothetical protein
MHHIVTDLKIFPYLFSCSWNDKKCGHENFTQVLTDHGVCYVFNGKGQKTLFVSESGKQEISEFAVGQ